MKHDSEIKVWALALVTSGIYILYWLYSRSSAIRQLQPSHLFNGKKQVFYIVSSLLMCLALLYITLNLNPNTPGATEEDITLYGYAIRLTFFASILYVFVIARAFHQAGVAIREAQQRSGSASIINPNLVWFYMFVFYYGLPYLQRHLNNIISHAKEQNA